MMLRISQENILYTLWVCSVTKKLLLPTTMVVSLGNSTTFPPYIFIMASDFSKLPLCSQQLPALICISNCPMLLRLLPSTTVVAHLQLEFFKGNIWLKSIEGSRNHGVSPPLQTRHPQPSAACREWVLKCSIVGISLILAGFYLHRVGTPQTP